MSVAWLVSYIKRLNYTFIHIFLGCVSFEIARNLLFIMSFSTNYLNPLKVGYKAIVSNFDGGCWIL